MVAYLRARNAPQVVVGLALISCSAYIVARALLRGGHGSQDSLIPVILWAPVSTSAVMSFCLTSSMIEVEEAAPRRIRAYTAGLVALLTLSAVLALVPAGSLGGEIYGNADLIRNVIGTFGIALLLAPVVGGRLAWSGPVVFGLVVNGVAPNAGPTPPVWAWPLRGAGDMPAVFTALSLFAAGFVTTLRWHSRAHRAPELG